MAYLIEGHGKLRRLRTMRERKRHKGCYQYDLVAVTIRECEQFTQYGHLPSLEDLDKKNPRYTRLVDYQ